MLVFRSFAIGLLAACFALLAMRSPIELRVAPPTIRCEQHHTDLPVPAIRCERHHTDLPVPTIIDAAPGITVAQLAATIRLAPGEHVTSIDDTSVAGDVGAGLVLASRDIRSRQFIDFGVSGPAGERRVLVLLH